jgi:hypothetical protein
MMRSFSVKCCAARASATAATSASVSAKQRVNMAIERSASM